MRFADRVAQLKPSPTLAIAAKAKEMKAAGINVIGFGVGEPDFDTPDNIKDAAVTAIKKGVTKYTPASGTPELKEAVCEKLKKDNSLIYKPDEIAISCGAKHAIYNIFQVLCQKGDEVLIISPYWVSYPEIVRLSGAEPKFITAEEGAGFAPDPKGIVKHITGRTKAIIVNSPSNPAGAVFDRKLLEKISEIAVAKKIFVISDEIYEKLIYDGEKHISIGSLGKDIFKQTITVNGVSKTYSMTGWRIGYAAGPADIIKKIGALQSQSTSNPASMSQAAAFEALRGSQDASLEMAKEFASRRDIMTEGISSLMNISCVKPKGAFYAFCNISGTALDSMTFSGRLLDEAHVACVPGIGFGWDSHVRLSFATDSESIKTGLERLGKWLQEL